MPRSRKSKPHQDTRTHTHACTILNQNLIRSALKKRLVEQPQCRVGQGGEGNARTQANTYMCTQTHTNICLGAQTHTHVPVCLAERTFVGVRSLACICRLVALSKFNSHMETGKRIHADPSCVVRPEMA